MWQQQLVSHIGVPDHAPPFCTAVCAVCVCIARRTHGVPPAATTASAAAVRSSSSITTYKTRNLLLVDSKRDEGTEMGDS